MARRHPSGGGTRSALAKRDGPELLALHVVPAPQFEMQGGLADNYANGVMFADVGHGVALFAFGLYLVYRTAYKNWGELILVLSFSTVLFGFVRGSFFGVPFTSPLEKAVSLPAQSPRGSRFPRSLPARGPVLIGRSFHLASGYAIAFLNQERAGNYLEAFLDRLPTVGLFSFLVPFGFGPWAALHE